MKKIITIILCLSFIFLGAPTAFAQRPGTTTSGPLFDQLHRQDSLLFHYAQKDCNAQKVQEILTKDFVFYHDNGLDNPTTVQPLADFTNSIKKICMQGHLRRTIVPGSLQVFAVSGQEAIQTGVQHFYVIPDNQPEQLVEISKFTRTWKKEGNAWKMARELDYQVTTEFPEMAGERYQPAPYIPGDKALYDTIVNLDSIYFDTYNTCNLEKMKDMMTDDMEFYHDRGGLQTSKEEYIAAIKNNICNKVQREIMKGSIEVYSINGYGAVEIGYHRFHNLVEGSTSHASKFITLWKRNNGHWQMNRIISLH
ncbi:nuclear transport factor 2 family protein [Chitinophaga sp. GbtcB8]|uniref:nuclear transport factor 2 family protein n=1 Tax=Chitinophaga sp. GbtcB8 TaxID=2824753 RepID=UPI001C2FE409|nr:nuclear transport factor 2 family protein [Chitinophaga sp. GbtcB8]